MATPPTPYLKLGRGGAGNYLSPTAQPLQHATNSSLSPADDIESQPSPSISDSTASTTAKTPSAQAEYAHSGRGGAGNWFSPRELTATGMFESTAPSASTTASAAVSGSGFGSRSTTAADGAMALPPAPTTATATPAASPSVPVAGPTYYGRGGAGNYNARSVEEGRRKGEEEEQERERRREEIGEMARREVERGLRRPEGAYLRGVRVEDV